MSNQFGRVLVRCAIGIAVLAALGGLAAWAGVGLLSSESSDEGGLSHHDSPAAQPIAVQVIRPRVGRSGFKRSITQPAFVQGFYKADLMARVPGQVKWITKNIGDEVKEGEVLLELD